jgi:hypothetical protein
VSTAGEDLTGSGKEAWPTEAGAEDNSSIFWETDQSVSGEELPSFNEVREIAASSILDINPGNKCCPFIFFSTARGMSSISGHLRFWEEDERSPSAKETGWVEHGGEEVEHEDREGGCVIDKVVGLTYGWNRERRWEFPVNLSGGESIRVETGRSGE